MSNINALFDALDAAQVNAREPIRAALATAWDDCAALQDTLGRLESADVGDRYYWTQHGEIAACLDCPIPIEAREREFFADYLMERGALYDADTETLNTLVGPSLVIDADGDVFDQDGSKTVIRASQYCASELNQYRDEDEAPLDDADDDARRNVLIEAYMERTGCFPGVFRADRYGNLFPVNTRGPA